MKKSVGDYIVSQGVSVSQLYGRQVGLLGFPAGSHPEPVSSAEIGTVVETLPKETNKEWEWFKFSSSIKPHFIPDGYGTYELVVEV